MSKDRESFRVYRLLGRQLLRSGTSIGSNTEEAQSGQSRADFISKYTIALKEARETIYRRRLIQETLPPGQIELAGLLQEAKEISRIIGTIIVSAKSKN